MYSTNKLYRFRVLIITTDIDANAQMEQCIVKYPSKIQQLTETPVQNILTISIQK